MEKSDRICAQNCVRVQYDFHFGYKRKYGKFSSKISFTSNLRKLRPMSKIKSRSRGTKNDDMQNGTGAADSRLESSRSIAEKSITKMVRSSVVSTSSQLVSSTPTGFHNTDLSNDSNEQWPGPFSTAAAMIRKREEVKLARLAAIAQKSEGKAVDVDEIDDIDAKIHEIKWIPKEQRSEFKLLEISPLMELCLNYVVQNFDSITDLGNVSNILRERMASQLASERRLNHNFALILALRGSGALSIPDCSSLAEDTIVEVSILLATYYIVRSRLNALFVITFFQALHRVGGDASDDALCDNDLKDLIPHAKRPRLDVMESSLRNVRVLQLKNCGRCFSDKVSSLLSGGLNEGDSTGLEILSLTGSYKLSDAGLSQLLSRSASLRTLELCCCNRLGPASINAMASHLQHLESLSISGSPHLMDQDLLPLATVGCFPSLAALSLEGMPSLSDDFASNLLR